MKTQSILPQLKYDGLSGLKPLKPEALARILDAFHRGELKSAALLWDTIERRDDVLQGVISKRKKSVARLGWEVLVMEDSPEAYAHQQALSYFYNNVRATHACDANQLGGFSLLIKQMMDAVGKKYAVHEIIYDQQTEGLSATFQFVPLWYFTHKEGRLQFTQPAVGQKPIVLEAGEWLVTTADGLMEASSIAYLFKHLPLCDWLIYCERNGMPGVKGITDAHPQSAQWEAARSAVEDFNAQFCALMGRGTDMEVIDLTARGELPYPRLIERMDRAMIALWRGADLSTLSNADSVGASIQQTEADLLEDDDALHLSEILNTQVDPFVIEKKFKTKKAKAYIKLKLKDRQDRQADLDLMERLLAMGLSLSQQDLRERFGVVAPQANEAVLHPQR